MSSNNEEIIELIEDHLREAKALRRNLLKLCWYMRGSITIDQIYELSYDDREMISKLIDENLATTKETGLPFF